MSKSENYFKQIGTWEKEQADPTNWKQHIAPTETVEDFAHKILNDDPDTRDKNGYLTLENILASSCVSISDTYRSGSTTVHLKKIEDMMQHYKTNAPIVLYRGVSEVPYEKM